MADDLEIALKVLIGEELATVTFVRDYWQLGFDGPSLTMISRITVKGPNWQMSDGAPEFRNCLCERIGQAVTAVSFRDGECLAVAFKDGTSVEASLRAQDYRGPEAVHVHLHGPTSFDYVL